MSVKSGDTVRVHYTGTLQRNGEEFDSSRREGRSPLEFAAGSGQVIPGFDAGVLGLEPGGTVTVTIEPDDAYGPRHEELVQTVPVDHFADETPPEVGGMVNLIAPDGQAMPGVITAIEDGQVTLDFNHPLAGETLVFEIELVEIVG